ncbi:PQQ-dependent sugar dehydrogenase, partial [Candidatus Poribacteria bacterium]|nr:PQQ-dependent sugar dehydrogenase [Candidatus Poribacteria bacterium]
DKNSELVVLEIAQPFSNHNGGQIAFGPDGYLYIGMGDGGSGGDPFGNGQNLKTLLGAILRIDVNTTVGNQNYGIPPSNPYVGNPGGFREEIYAYGLRNPWRFSFDPLTHWLWAADVGQNDYEEIDIIQSGENYGWNVMEGLHCFNPRFGCDTKGMELPIWEYDHRSGQSITGGFVYRGNNVPELRGAYIYADFVSGRLWSLRYDGINPVENRELLRTNLSIASFGTDQEDELYICAFDGKIYRLKPTVSAPPWDVNADGVVDIFDLVLVASQFGHRGVNLRGDVNGDGTVDIFDLVLIGTRLGEAAIAAAPNGGGALNAELLKGWLVEARRVDDGSETFRRGIGVLESVGLRIEFIEISKPLLDRIIPEQTALLPNYPNPFNPETWMPYELAESAWVAIEIYSATGQLIRTLELGLKPPGRYISQSKAAYWNGLTEWGEKAASGVYFYVLKVNHFSATRKMIIRK